MANNHNISAIAVLDLARELKQLNILDHNILAKLESDLVERSQQSDMDIALELRADEKALVNLWRLAAESLVCPEVGILIGSKVNPDAKGVLANWISQCKTLNEAFEVFNDNIVLLNAAENWTLERLADCTKLTFSFTSMYEYPTAAIERSMSALVMWASDLSGGEIVVESATFQHAVPEYQDLYLSIFGPNITFSATENALIFKSLVFDKSIKSANPYLQEIVATRAKKLLSYDLVGKSDVVYSIKVRELLFSNLLRFNSIESVCQKMHVSRTSLYRKLKIEGTTFREILEAVQLEKYQQGLMQGSSVNELCDLLGFSDPSTFYKAKKRWVKGSTEIRSL
jgi:AraC-like DNA-binding protein